MGNIDGNFFEACVILDILTERIKSLEKPMGFKKIKVKSLFEFKFKDSFNFEKYKNKNLLIVQESLTGEIFDFAFVIYENGKVLMKLFQVSTKKTKKDLEKLDIGIIELHCFSIQKEFEKYGVKIDNFSFGIITSKTAFDKYKDKQNLESSYKIMKDLSEKNNYELLIYDIEKRNINIEVSKNLEEYSNLYSFGKTKILKLPDYSNFFGLNPRLITTKNINPNYNDFINQYLDANQSIKIIEKVEYQEKMLMDNIKDNNFGVLISGLKKIKTDKQNSLWKTNKREPQIYNEIRIFKSYNKTFIYEKNQESKQINEINNKITNLENIHVILIKIKDQKFIGKKRYPEKLFLENLIKKRKKKNEKEELDEEQQNII